MKMVIVAAISGLWTALGPSGGGCGAGAGSDTASGPSSSSSTPEAPIATGALPLVDCGALGMHVFCEDFSGALPGHFATENISAGALTIDPSHVLVATTDHVTTSTRALARLHKDISATGTRFAIGFMEWVDATCVGNADLVQTGSITMNGGKYFLTVGHGQNGDSLVETSLVGGFWVQSHVLRTPLPRGAWAHLVLDADLTNGTASLTLEGTKIMDAEPLEYAPKGAQTPAVEIGTLTDNITFNPSACKVQLDDVTFDVQP